MKRSEDLPDFLQTDESFRLIIEHLQDALFVVQDGRVVYCNEAFSRMTGHPIADLTGAPIGGLIAPEDREMVLSRYRTRVAGGSPPEDYEFNLLHSDGETRIPVLMSVGALTTVRGVVVGTLKDISALRDAMNRLRASEQEFRDIINNMPDVFYRTDAEGRITMMSPVAEKILGYPIDELIGMKITDLYVNPEDRQVILRQLAENQGHATAVESKMRARDGHVVWASTNAFMRYDAEGRPIGVEGISRDITQRRLMEDRLRYLAGHDQLTDLPNRSEFMRRLDHAIKRAKRDGTPVALLFIDLDGFKEINDNYGHDAGDQLLTVVGSRLKGILREADTAARLGGDEFILLLEGDQDRQGIEAVAERVIDALGQTYTLSGRRVTISASVGVAVFPDDASKPDTLIQRADDAMYAAKHAGKNRYHFHSAE